MAVSTPQPPTAHSSANVSHGPGVNGQSGPTAEATLRSSSVSSATTASTSTSHPASQLKPIGIHNESNTCFLNSTFQALSATAPLTSLLSTSPHSPLYIHPESSLPVPAIHPKLIPSLHPDILEPPLYDLTPVTRAFTQSLHKAWRMKEAGGGTSGSGETSSKRSMSLVPLLREIARKYDQYDDYSQQDAHELLRHLLDSMEMEEKDVIKKIQPIPPEQPRTRRRRSRSQSGNRTPLAYGNHDSNVHMMDLRHISPMASPLPSPAHTRPPSPGHVSVDPMLTVGNSIEQQLKGIVTGQVVSENQASSPTAALTHSRQNGVSDMVKSVPAEERLVPFVDVLFGGSLASVVVCERCKAVSHTYEGFLDISLSLKGDDPKPRKRDRLRAMARKLKPRKSSATQLQPTQSPEIHHSNSFPSVVSDGEYSESETPTEKSLNRRRSLDQDDRSSGLGRSSSSKAFSGLKNKSSFTFRRKGTTKSAGASPVISASTSSVHSFDTDKHQTPPSSHPGSPKMGHHNSHNNHHGHHHHHSHHGPGPTPAQAAYIARILSPASGSPDDSDPLARLRAANSGSASGSSPVIPVPATPEWGLIECLKAFTSVEVLEGENAFACHKCWKIKHGRYDKHEATVREEDEDNVEQISREETGTSSVSTASASSSIAPVPIVNPRAHNAAPAISILGSPSGESTKSTTSSYFEDDSRLGREHRNPSIASSASRSSIVRAPSPLRRQYEGQDQETLVEQMSNTSLSTTYGSESALTIASSTGTGTSTEAEGDADADTHDYFSSSDGLSDSESSAAEDATGRPKLKRKKTNHAHVVMGRAFKRYLIAKAPEVLVFHFKRFKQTQKSNYGFSSFYDLKKMDEPVSFPETLDLAPFIAPNRKDYKLRETANNGLRATYMDWPNPDQGPTELEPVLYRLYAVVVHLGTMIGGHYIAYCLVDPEKMFGPRPADDTASVGLDEAGESATPMFGARGAAQERASQPQVDGNGSVNSGQTGRSSAGAGGSKKDKRVWCFCSDTSIRLASLEEVLSQKAYLCFYEKLTR